VVGDLLQPTHLLFVLVIALLVLGPKRLPEVARTLGNGLRDFRAAINGEHSDDDDPSEGELTPYVAPAVDETHTNGPAAEVDPAPATAESVPEPAAVTAESVPEPTEPNPTAQAVVNPSMPTSEAAAPPTPPDPTAPATPPEPAAPPTPPETRASATPPEPTAEHPAPPAQAPEPERLA
jgi:sec-independent protein translocase protein TatA